MLQRACVLTNYNQYESKRHFAFELAQGLTRQGIETEIFDAEDPLFKKMPKFKIEEFSPDITISFHSFMPDHTGKFLFDWFQIPHLSILVDPALYYLDMAASPYSILSVVDQFDIEVLKGFGCDKVFFLPHGANRELASSPESEKEFDVVFIGSCYDYLSLRSHWRGALSAELSSILEQAADLFLNDNVTSLQSALTEIINSHDEVPKNMDFLQMFRFLDIYTRGLDRIQLIRSLKDVKVHIFGGSCEGDLYPTRGWKDYVADMPNVQVHDPVNYDESLEILKKSKISLNSSPFFKNGSHERLFVPPLLNTLVVSNDTVYTRKEFVDGKDIILCPPKGWEFVNERVVSLIKDEDKRRHMVAQAKSKVLEKHTWDERAKTIKNEVPRLIEMINDKSQ